MPERNQQGGVSDGANEEQQKEAHARRTRKGRGWLPLREPPVNSVSVAPSRMPAEDRRAAPGTNSAPHSGGISTFDPELVVPPLVRDKYVRVGSTYHFQDGDIAFRVTPTRTTTQFDSPEVVRDMLEIERARSNGAPLQVTGSKAFRAEAWRQAARLGIELVGYSPTKFERAQLEKEQFEEAARKKAAAEVRADAAARLERAASAQAPGVTDSGGGLPPREPAVPPAARVYRGRLVAHGTARFKHDPEEDWSYYATVETREGVQTVWGKDLERAIKGSKSHAERNDKIVIQHAGEEPVVVKRRHRDDQGEIVVKEEVQRYRNRWIVEKQSFIQEREEIARIVRDPGTDPREAVQKHPRLEGTFLQIHAAKLVSQELYHDEASRRAFVERFRNQVANDIARGERFPDARLYRRLSAERDNGREPRQHQQERVLN